MVAESGGALAGVKVLEFAGIGPVPVCGMMLSDMGADVLRIDRPGAVYDKYMVETRGRRSLVVDMKSPEGQENILRLIEKADVLIEGYRPGVMERLGLAPDIALSRNPRLVYGRMTGWGQYGPYAHMAGHDINYIAITGALHAIGTTERPVPPLNLVGDFGGGALYLAFGVLAALRHAEHTGQGQVIDCAMSDGTIGLMGMLYGHQARGSWRDERGVNIIDGGAHFYNCYQCSDGNWIALGAIEPQFYAELRRIADMQDADFDGQMTQENWPYLKQKLAGIIATKTRDEWTVLFEGGDACFAPVLNMSEARHHPHNKAREAFVAMDDVQHPAPAPRLSVTPGAIQGPPVGAGDGGVEAARQWGVELQ
ncbi:MAG: CoA transferase [Sphingobium sp.]|nr:CoA transferase [Sphingobium sp.]